MDELRGWLRILFGTKKEFSSYRDADGKLRVEVVVRALSRGEMHQLWWVKVVRAIKYCLPIR